MKPTPKNMRRFGDGLLGFGTFITAATMNTYPNLAMTALIVGAVGKFFTNFFEV
jgi:hypothetical protein